MSYIEFNDVYKTYKMGEININALDGASFQIQKGELVIILGPSGAGKTTTLNILGGMDSLTSGSVIIDNNDISSLKGKDLITYRRHDVGFVFQFYNLVQNFTALENVELAVQLCKDHMDPKEALRLVGLEDKINNFPAQLSGGEQQRVAIARAIAKKPRLLLCDEPTGALDYKTGKQILSLLEQLVEEKQMTIVIVTHNSAIAPMANKVIRFKNGKVEDVTINDNPTKVSEIEW